MFWAESYNNTNNINNIKEDKVNKNSDMIDKIIRYFSDKHLEYRNHPINKERGYKMIAFDGADATGKTTLIGKVQEMLHSQNHYITIVYKDSVPLFSSTNFDNYLNFNKERYHNTLSIKRIKYKTIVNYSENDVIILYDRYIYSTIIYQIIFMLASDSYNASMDTYFDDYDSLKIMVDFVFLSANYMIPDIVVHATDKVKEIKQVYLDNFDVFYDNNIIIDLYNKLFSALVEVDTNMFLIKYDPNKDSHEDIYNKIINKILKT